MNAKIAGVNVPGGLTARRAAGGRTGAKRWEICQGTPDPEDHEAVYAAWLGDIVEWQPEGVWDWQPRDGDPQTYPDASQAVAAIFPRAAYLLPAAPGFPETPVKVIARLAGTSDPVRYEIHLDSGAYFAVPESRLRFTEEEGQGNEAVTSR